MRGPETFEKATSSHPGMSPFVEGPCLRVNVAKGPRCNGVQERCQVPDCLPGMLEWVLENAILTQTVSCLAELAVFSPSSSSCRALRGTQTRQQSV